jgi:hypothetical protein
MTARIKKPNPHMTTLPVKQDIGCRISFLAYKKKSKRVLLLKVRQHKINHHKLRFKIFRNLLSLMVQILLHRRVSLGCQKSK